MSRMSEISMEIENYLDEGIHPFTIAKMLDIPLRWVYETMDTVSPDDQYYERLAESHIMPDVGCEFDPKF